jgi:hypothetical protein
MIPFSQFINEKSPSDAKQKLDHVSTDKSILAYAAELLREWYQGDFMKNTNDVDSFANCIKRVGSVYYTNRPSTLYRTLRIRLPRYMTDSQILKMTEFTAGNKAILSWAKDMNAALAVAHSLYSEDPQAKLRALVVVSSNSVTDLIDSPSASSFLSDLEAVYNIKVPGHPVKREHEVICLTPDPCRGKIEKVLTGAMK